MATAHETIHAAVNQALVETGNLFEVYAAICVAKKMLDVLVTDDVRKRSAVVPTAEVPKS